MKKRSKKVGLKANGSLKKGYRFAKGGRVVKAKAKKTTAKKTRRKRK